MFTNKYIELLGPNELEKIAIYEDSLTNDVLGALNYMPPNVALKLLGMRNAGPGEQLRLSLWPVYQGMRLATKSVSDSSLRKLLNSEVRPDGELAVGRSLWCVEAKLKSGWSGPQQVFREVVGFLDSNARQGRNSELGYLYIGSSSPPSSSVPISVGKKYGAPTGPCSMQEAVKMATLFWSQLRSQSKVAEVLVHSTTWHQILAQLESLLCMRKRSDLLESHNVALLEHMVDRLNMSGVFSQYPIRLGQFANYPKILVGRLTLPGRGSEFKMHSFAQFPQLQVGMRISFDKVTK